MSSARVAMLAVLVACGGAASKSTGGGSPSVEAASAVRASHATAPAADAPAADAPRVVVTGEVLEAGGVDLVLQNHDAVPVRLAADVAVERVGSGAAEVVAATALSLRFACDTPPIACLDLVPGAELRPPSWLASVGRAQCNEVGAEHAPPGRYRFVAHTCDGARIDGAPFELPAAPAAP